MKGGKSLCIKVLPGQFEEEIIGFNSCYTLGQSTSWFCVYVATHFLCILLRSFTQGGRSLIMASVLLDILTIPPADALTVPFGLLQCHDGNTSGSRSDQTKCTQHNLFFFCMEPEMQFVVVFQDKLPVDRSGYFGYYWVTGKWKQGIWVTRWL